MQPDPQPVAAPQPMVFLRRYWWQSLYVAAFGSMAVASLLAGWPLLAPVWLAGPMALVVVEWLAARTETPLDEATATALVDAASAHPPRTWLLDRETGDLLRVVPIRILGLRRLRVDRLPDVHRIEEEVEADFAAGRLSTIPSVAYLIRDRSVSAVERVHPVQVGDGGRPEPYRPPGRRRQLRDLLLRIRTGSMRVTEAEVAELVAQLRRVEPIRDEPEEEHADA